MTRIATATIQDFELILHDKGYLSYVLLVTIEGIPLITYQVGGFNDLWAALPRLYKQAGVQLGRELPGKQLQLIIQDADTVSILGFIAPEGELYYFGPSTPPVPDSPSGNMRKMGTTYTYAYDEADFEEEDEVRFADDPDYSSEEEVEDPYTWLEEPYKEDYVEGEYLHTTRDLYGYAPEDDT